MAVSIPDGIFDPTLSIFSGSDNSELDELSFGNSSPTDFRQDGPTCLDTPVSPSYTMDSLLGLQLDPSMNDTFSPDWGELDDQLYRQQLHEGADGLADEQRSDKFLDRRIFHRPETVKSPELHAFTQSSGDISKSLADVSLGSPKVSAMAPNPTLSRSGSTSSNQTERGRSRVTGKPKLQKPQPTELAFQEHTFRARSTSRASASSGRRGPLDAEARAKMVAVKGVGPCWRCKVLRKSVSA
jgi:hypothetical protein